MFGGTTEDGAGEWLAECVREVTRMQLIGGFGDGGV